MELIFRNEGDNFFKIKKDKIFYKRKLEKEEKENILGYVKVSDLKKKKLNIVGSSCLLSVMNKQLPLREFYKNEKALKKVCGYLNVTTGEGKSCFVAIVSRRKCFNSLPFALFLSNMTAISGTVVAIAAITTLMTGSVLFMQKQLEKDEPTKKIEKETGSKEKDEGSKLVFGKADNFAGGYIDSNGDTVEKEAGQILKPLYMDISLKKGSPLQLVNDPSNDAILQYDMTCNGKSILSIAIKPGKSINDWCPSSVLPVGENNITLLLSSYSLDGKTKDDVTTRNDFKITILN